MDLMSFQVSLRHRSRLSPIGRRSEHTVVTTNSKIHRAMAKVAEVMVYSDSSPDFHAAEPCGDQQVATASCIERPVRLPSMRRDHPGAQMKTFKLLMIAMVFAAGWPAQTLP